MRVQLLGLNLSGKDETVTAVFYMKSVGKNIWNGGEYGIEASVITAVVLALAAALLWYGNRKRDGGRYGCHSNSL